MKSIKYFFLVLAFLISCSEKYPDNPFTDGSVNDKTNSDGGVRNFPDAIGSYWIYEYYQLDSNSALIPASKSNDSVVVTGELEKVKRKAKQFTTFTKQSGNYSKKDDKYYSVDGKKLLTLQSYLSVFMAGFPLNVSTFSDTEWIKIIDPDDDLWRIYRMKLENPPVVGKVDVLCSWEGTKTFKINGKTVTADEYLISFEFIATISIPLIGDLPVNITRELFQYYSNDIGLVYSRLNSSKVSIPIYGNIPLPGFESKLIKYYINK